ncbi:methyltransferase [Bradyrhizobium sp. DASA03076]|uniref:methyltransferase n=1 Tax=Bradyrhizobium sp. BLXBL-03 TaxID=3395916 RepID=UPI003F6EC8AB
MTTNAFSDLTRLINGYQISQAIHVAARLGIANHLSHGPLSSDELARLSGSHPRTLYRLLRALASAGVFHEAENRTFSLTAMGECLRSDSPTPLDGWAAYVGRPYAWQAWAHLEHSVRTGENAFRHLNGQSVWEYRSARPDENAIFNRAMTANSRGAIEAIIAACDFSRFRHVADIGGGQGQLLAGILAANKALRGTLFDQPHVVSHAADVLNRHGVADRCEIVAGSFFESIPEGADAYVMRAIIHDWDDKDAISILKTCRRAMTDDARLLLVERVVEPPNEGLISKLSDLNMLVMLGALERTYDEYSALCKAAGFKTRGTARAGSLYQVIEAVPSKAERV